MVATYTQGDEPVPGYRLLNLLGWGRFGEVWKAGAPGGFEAALKLISLSTRHGVKEYRAIRLFRQIRHPNLVPLMGLWLKDKLGNFIDEDVVEESGNLENQAAELIVAMGLGEKSLFDRLKECQEKLRFPGIPGWELLGYMEQMAGVLDYLHLPIHDFGRGPHAIQHCDIKPHNILIVGKAAQLCDLGVARALEDPRSTAAMGSAAYISPECISLGRPSPASDQYSLAISYVELRTGVLPIEARSIAVAYMAHMNGKVDLSRLPPAEQQVIRRAIAVDPKERFTDLRSMVRDLEQAVLEGERRGEDVIAPIPSSAPSNDDEEMDLAGPADDRQPAELRTVVLRNAPSAAEDDWNRSAAAALSEAPQAAALAVVDSEPQPEPAAPALAEDLPAAAPTPEPTPDREPVLVEQPVPSEHQPAAVPSPVGPLVNEPKQWRLQSLKGLRGRRHTWAVAALAATCCLAFAAAMFVSWWRASSSVGPTDRNHAARQAKHSSAADSSSTAAGHPDRPSLPRTDARSWELRARADHRAGHSEDALREAELAIRLDPKLPEPLFIRASILVRRKQYERALADLDRAIDLAPREPRYRFARTVVLGRWSPERLDAWTNELTRQIESSSESALLLVERAHAALLKGEYERAIQDCTRALTREPQCAAALAVRARGTVELHRQGREASLGQAVDDATQAVRLDPGLCLAFYARALARWEMGIRQNREAIIADLDHIAGLDPLLPEVIRKRAELWSILGDYDRAKADFQSAEKLEGSLGL